MNDDVDKSKFKDDLQSSIRQLMERPGNNSCVECKGEDVTHVNFMLGVFLCEACAMLHQSLRPGLNRVLPKDSSKITNEDIRILTTIGNNANREFYESGLPSCYKRPTHADPVIFMEQWIKAKYERKEFTRGMPLPSYMEKVKEGNLWKRGKDSNEFKLRRFVLCKQDKILKYYVKEGPNSQPKAELNLDVIDAFVVPEKIKNPHGMQIVFESNGKTRSLFVYADSAEEVISWYTAIYAAKLQWLQIAFPCAPIEELRKRLWPRILKEGWLMKCGPKKSDKFYRRWVTLFNRKLIYCEDSMDPFPKGEVFIGTNNFSVEIPNGRDQYSGFVFLVKTPHRVFTFMAERDEERRDWTDVITSIIGTPLLPFELKEETRNAVRVSKRISSLFIK